MWVFLPRQEKRLIRYRNLRTTHLVTDYTLGLSQAPSILENKKVKNERASVESLWTRCRDSMKSSIAHMDSGGTAVMLLCPCDHTLQR